MNRRDFLKLAGLGAAGLIVRRFAPVAGIENPPDRTDYNQAIRHHSMMRLDNFGISARTALARIKKWEAACAKS